MSSDALSWAFRLVLPPTEKFLLVALADRAHGADGVLWGSVGDMIERTGLARRTINITMAKLVQRELVSVLHRFDPKTGRQRSNEYQVNFGEDGGPYTKIRPLRRGRRPKEESDAGDDGTKYRGETESSAVSDAPARRH